MHGIRLSKRAMLTVLLLAAALVAVGQQVVKDFSVPEYAPDGRMKSHLRGARAVIDGQGDADIDDLLLDIFPENGQNIRVMAAACRYQRRLGLLESDGAVRIETPGLLITGTGFNWNINQENGVIRSNASVTIKQSGGLYQREPKTRD